mgnify:CR=1 FL=1
MTTVIPATETYRAKVAAAAAAGAIVPTIAHVAWGTGNAPASPSDQDLDNEAHRQSPDSAVADGVTLTVQATLSGASVPGLSIQEIGLFDSDGDLAARRVHSPLELDSGTSIVATLDLQF